jgi:hypothetical protein
MRLRFKKRDSRAARITRLLGGEEIPFATQSRKLVTSNRKRLYREIRTTLSREESESRFERAVANPR